MKNQIKMFEKIHSNEMIKKTPCECPICYEPLGETNVCITKCGHKFCIGCLFKHSERSNDCPMCREQIVDNFENRNNRSRSSSFNDDEFINRINEGLSVPVDDMDAFMRRRSRINAINSTYDTVNIPNSENSVIDLTRDSEEEISINYDDDENTDTNTIDSENDSNEVNDEEDSIERLITELDVIQEETGVFELSTQGLMVMRMDNDVFVESVKSILLKQTLKKFINHISENTNELLYECDESVKHIIFMRLNNIINNEENSFESYINDPNSVDSDDILNLLNISRNRFGKTLETDGYDSENMKLCLKFTDLIYCMNNIIVNNRDRN
jgi:hypothetical protein